MNFAIRNFCSLASFVNLTSGSRVKRSTDSSCFTRRSCRLCASDFVIRPRFPFGRGGISGNSLPALGQDGPVSLAYGQALVLAQGLGGALVDPVTGLARQLLHQARPGFDIVRRRGDCQRSAQPRFRSISPCRESLMADCRTAWRESSPSLVISMQEKRKLRRKDLSCSHIQVCLKLGYRTCSLESQSNGRRGGVVTQRIANPKTPVRFRSSPPFD